MADWPYSTATWRRSRRIKLDANPLCQPRNGVGRLVLANTVDHAVPIGEVAHPPPGRKVRGR